MKPASETDDVFRFNFKTDDWFNFPKGYGSTHSLHKDTLTSKIKIWAIQNGYEIISGGLSDSGEWKVDIYKELTKGVHGYVVYEQSVFNKNEAAGVIEAGLIVLKLKNKKD